MCSMLLMKLMEDFIPHVKSHSVVSVVFETNYLTNFKGAPNDQFVVKCIIIPQLMKINVIKAFSGVF